MSNTSISDRYAAELLQRTFAEGERTSLNSGLLRWAGDCIHPVHVTLEGERSERKPPRKQVAWAWSEKPGLAREGHWQKEGMLLRSSPGPRGQSYPPTWIDIEVRCRRCEACLRMRQRHWSARVHTELSAHDVIGARTWFGTLTLSPEEQFRALVTARLNGRAGGIDLDRTSEEEIFRSRVGVISRWLTLYLKRVRKGSGFPFRYLLVCEKHKTGLPHYHVLIHEDGPLRNIPKRILQDQWIHGFSRWKLVEDMRQGTYLTKYLSKSPEARVRASKGYGQQNPLLGIANSV